MNYKGDEQTFKKPNTRECSKMMDLYCQFNEQ